ncbi:hypothetical protein NX059_001469 [Plenodomus lindquistii]|nr:hypothetical protein NX059_001469 [Plenodomus lindquistii]
MAGLTTIPQELLDKIAAHLDRSALLALALTSKSGNVSANIVLYRAYVNLEPPAKAPIHLFLRTICERPDLAEKVREVSIRGWRSEYEMATGLAWRGTIGRSEDTVGWERKGPVYSNKDNTVRTTHAQRSRIFLDAAVGSGLISRPKVDTAPPLKKNAVWYSSLKEDMDFVRLLGWGVEDAHVLLLIGLLPKLRCLRIDGLSPYPLLDWYHFLSRSTTALRRVNAIFLHGTLTNDTEPVVCHTLQLLDMVPNLKVLGIENIAVKGHHFGLQTLPSRTLSSFNCTNGAIGLRLLEKLLHGQPLTYVAYIVSYRRSSLVPNAACSFTDITKLLSASRSTLKNLAINPTEYSTEKHTRWSEFSRLETLELPHPGLMNMAPEELDTSTVAEELRKQMPNTVTTLSLRHLVYEPQVMIMLEQLVRLKAEGTLPALRLVLLQFSRSSPSFTFGFPTLGAAVGGTAWLPLPDVEPQVQKKLAEMFSKAGIELDIRQED